MKKYLLLTVILLVSALCGSAADNSPAVIEVTGTATLNIVPDRITIEIGMEEYYRHSSPADSTLVPLREIERGVRRLLLGAGVPDSMIVVSDLGNYRDRDLSSAFLMAKRLSAVVTDLTQIVIITDRLSRDGITSFSIVKTDNSDMELYNREGLKAALHAARLKAEFIAENEGLELLMPYEIKETTNEPAAFSAVSNVQFNQGSGIDNMRPIVRHYSVKVRYLFTPAKK